MSFNATDLLHQFLLYRYSLHNFLTQNYYFSKVRRVMKPKNGFLLIELIVGLSVSIFFILIITHYIIEVKVTQQKALKRIEDFSLVRNEKEKIFAKKYGAVHA